MRRFTAKFVSNLKPKANRYEVWEGAGLGLRVTPKGRKSWIFLYRFDNRPRRMTLGRYPEVSVARAHKAHGEALEQLEQGTDPGAKKVKENIAERTAPTLNALADQYIERWAKPRKKSWPEDRRILDKEVLPKWGRWKARDIRRRDVIRLLDGIVHRGAPITANRTLEIIRRMFNWAIEQDILETTPCLRVRAPAPERHRDRVLATNEIRALWLALGRDRVLHPGRKAREDELDDLPNNWPGRAVRLALRLALVTAQRRNEIAGAAVSEFDLDEGWWTIPAERSKNGLSHSIPLPELAKTIVSELIDLRKPISKETGKFSIYLIPSPRGDKPIDPGALTRGAAVIRDNLDLDHWTVHDLRRTVASQMTSIGISRLVVSKILNHVESGITSVYDRHSYDNEKRDALVAWEIRLNDVVSGTPQSNIIQLPSAALL